MFPENQAQVIRPTSHISLQGFLRNTWPQVCLLPRGQGQCFVPDSPEPGMGPGTQQGACLGTGSESTLGPPSACLGLTEGPALPVSSESFMTFQFLPPPLLHHFQWGSEYRQAWIQIPPSQSLSSCVVLTRLQLVCAGASSTVTGGHPRRAPKMKAYVSLCPFPVLLTPGHSRLAHVAPEAAWYSQCGQRTGRAAVFYLP